MAKGKPRALDDPNLQQLARAAIQKLAAGQKPSRQELRAKTRLESDLEERRRHEYYRTIPKRHWVDMSGRQHKILDSQAKTYGLPIGGDSIDLPAVVRWIHDLLANRGRRLLDPESDEEMLSGGFSGDASTPALERYRTAKAALAELELAERKEQLVDREKIRNWLGQFAALLRNCGDALQKQHGPDALELLLETIADGERLLERECGVTQEIQESGVGNQEPDHDA